VEINLQLGGTAAVGSYIYVNLRLYYLRISNPSGRAVQGVGLWPLACWNCGFESHIGHGCLTVVGVLSCQVEVSASE